MRKMPSNVDRKERKDKSMELSHPEKQIIKLTSKNQLTHHIISPSISRERITITFFSNNSIFRDLESLPKQNFCFLMKNELN